MITKNFSFRENVVVITGASTRIGRELAPYLADQAAWLLLAARNAEMLEDVTAECRRRSGNTLVLATGITEQRQCAKLAKRALVKYGRIDTLINNAGITMGARADYHVSVTMVYPSLVGTRGRRVSRGIMSVDACARSIIKAAAQRKRDIVIPPIGRVGLWLRLIAPDAFDHYLCNLMEHQNNEHDAVKENNHETS